MSAPPAPNHIEEDHDGLPYMPWLLRMATEQGFCPRCEGDGSYSRLADCTTAGSDCACNGPSVIVDPCPACNGTGDWPLPGAPQHNTHD